MRASRLLPLVLLVLSLFSGVARAASPEASNLELVCWGAEDRVAAVASCRDALRQQPSWEGRVALARALMRDASGLAEAQALLEDAETKAFREPDLLFARAELATKQGNEAVFLLYADKLAKVAPDEARTAVLQSFAGVARGDADSARAARDRAKEKGTSARQLEAIDAAIAEMESAWTPTRVAKTGGIFVAAWLLAIGILFAAGSVLSRITLRATTGEATGGTHAVKRAYAVLLTVASVFYYVSLPVVALIVVGGVGATFYFFLSIGKIPIKLLAILGIVGLASLWAILKGIYATLRPPKDVDPGEELSLDDHPRLARVLAKVAGRIGTRTVDRVFLTPNTDMAVFERGGALQTARGRGERCLVIGAGLLRGMRLGSFKAILAHELGHFKNEDTAGGALSLAVRRSMIHMLVALVNGGAATAYNPAWLFASRYHRIFLRISEGASRLQEVLADRWAVVAYGSKPFVEGFEHVIARTVEHHARTQTTLREVIDGNRVLANLYTYEPEAPVDAAELAKAIEEARNAPADPYDSHPPPRERIDSALALAVEHAPEKNDDEDAWHLFTDRTTLEERLTDRVCEAVAENHAVVIRRSA